MPHEEEDACMAYEEEDTYLSARKAPQCQGLEDFAPYTPYEEEDTCMAYEEEDTYLSARKAPQGKGLEDFAPYTLALVRPCYRTQRRFHRVVHLDTR